MTDYVISAGRSSTYPVVHYGGHFVGNRATFCMDGDLINPASNVLAIPTLPVVSLNLNPVTVADTFFGMHILNRSNDSVTGLTFKTVRSHDIANGGGRWKYIETTDNVWNFTDLDSWVNTHYLAGRDLVFTLFGTPTWASARPTEEGAYGPANLGTQAEPTDMTKWDRYCAKIATRYLGKIKYYEIWNEPNAYNNGVSATPGTDFFFSGTYAKLSEMTRRANQAIKAVDPTAKIISSAVTTWSATASQSAEIYFTGMMAASDGATGTMAAWVDIIGVHLYLPYVNLVQNLPGIINRINAAKVSAGVSALPTWDTESAPVSIGSVAYLSDLSAQKLISRMLLIMAAKGIARTMYYQYDITSMGFSTRPNVLSAWQGLVPLLTGGTILAASCLFDGRVAYSTSAGLTIV